MKQPSIFIETDPKERVRQLIILPAQYGIEQGQRVYFGSPNNPVLGPHVVSWVETHILRSVPQDYWEEAGFKNKDEAIKKFRETNSMLTEGHPVTVVKWG